MPPGPVESGTARGTRSKTQTDAKENVKSRDRSFTRRGRGRGEGCLERLVPSQGALETLGVKEKKEVNRVERRLKDGRINEVVEGRRRRSVKDGGAEVVEGRKRSVKDGGNNEVVEGRRSVKERKDATQDAKGRRTPNGRTMLKKAQKKKEEEEEEEELDFAAIEKKIFDGQEKLLKCGNQGRDIKDNSVLSGRRSRTAMVKEGKEGRNSYQKVKVKESEEMDFAALEEKIFEGKEKVTPEKHKKEITSQRMQTEEEKGRKIRKSDVMGKEKDRKILRTTSGNITNKKEEEEEEEEETKDTKRWLRKEENAEKLVTEGKLFKVSPKVEKEEIKREKQGRKTHNTANIKRESSRERKERELPPSQARGRKGREKEEGKSTTAMPERGKTDTQRRKEDTKGKRGESKEKGNNSKANRQTERQRENGKQEKVRETTELPNRRHTNRNRGKDKEEERKRRGGGRKEEERGRGRDGGGKRGRKVAAEASDSELSEWEEVGEMEGVDEVKELLSQDSTSSQAAGGGGGGVRIELDAPDTLWGMRKRKKKRTEEQMIEDYLRRKVNDTIRGVAQNAHKVHLLCLVAHGRHLNATLGTGTLLGAALSTTATRDVHPPGRLDLTHLQRLVGWFNKKFPVSEVNLETDYWDLPAEEVLARRFGASEVRTCREAVLCFVVLCRALGFSARLVMALQPLSWKPAPGTLVKPAKTEDNVKTSSATSSSSVPTSSSSSSTSLPSSSSSSSSSSRNSEGKNKQTKQTNRKMLSSDSETSPIGQKDGRGNEKRGNKRRRTIEEEEEEDSDFKPGNTKFRKPKKMENRRSSQEEGKKRRKEGGGGGGGEEGRKKRKTEGMTEWAEVFVEEEEKWICVDVVRGKIHCTVEIEAKMPPGSAYVTAFNPDLTVKDVTPRYISRWLSSEKKLRCCSEWWAASLLPFRGAKTHREEEEDEEMEKALHLQPLPKTVAE